MCPLIDESIETMNLLMLAEGDSERLSAAGSGIPNAVVRHLRLQGHEVSTGDVDLDGWTKLVGAASSFSPKRQRWVVGYHLDPLPFALRSRRAVNRVKRHGAKLDAVIQWGATFSSAPSGVPYFLYCDSNIHISRNSAHSWAASLQPAEIERAIGREQKVYENAAGIFTLSECVRRSFVNDLSIPADRVETVYAGHNLDVGGVPPFAKLREGRTAPNVLFVGREFSRKGGDLLLRAFERVRQVIPDATLTIVGPKDLSLSTPGVESLGLLDKDDPSGFRRLVQAYERATVFAFPTRFEPFGIVLLEAMIFGLPCVAPRVWAVPEIVQDGETGLLFDPESVDGLTMALVRLLENPELALRMGCAGRTRVESQFTWEQVAARMTRRMDAELRSGAAARGA